MSLPEFRCYYVGPTQVEIRIPHKSDKIICKMRVSDIGVPYYDDLLNATHLLCNSFDLNLMHKIRQSARDVYITQAVYQSSQ